MIPRVALAPGYTISRIVKGGWQLAGGHGAIDRRTAIADMHAFVDAGITTFDCADIYTGVESLIGDFIRERGRSSDLQIHTKYVPDRSRLGRPDRRRRGRSGRTIAGPPRRRGARSGAVPLVGLRGARRDRRAGMARRSAPRRPDPPPRRHQLRHPDAVRAARRRPPGGRRTRCSTSVLDQRPAAAMRALCAARGVQLLCYGTVAGGLLGERYLGAAAAGRTARESLAGQVPADRRRGRRLGGAAAAAARARDRGGAPPLRHRRGGHRLGAAAAAGRRGHRRRAACPPPAGGSPRRDAGARSRRRARRLPRPWPPRPPYLATSTRWSASPGGRHAAVMRYELNSSG